MGVSRHNSEGYFDPTAYGALSAIEEKMKTAQSYKPIYARHFREMLPVTLQMHESTAAMPWRWGISPSLRICYFRSFLMTMI